jgi:capsular polysaccharide biosynthesis protein/Mrp family chromosome partitioning ATPase
VVTSDSDHLSRPDLLETLWRFRVLLVVCTMAAALAGLAVSSVLPVRYVASTQLVLADPSDATLFRPRRASSADRRLLNEADLVTSPEVAARAAEKLGGQLTPEEIRERVSAQTSADSDILEVMASDQSAEGAAAIANTVALAYQEIVAEQQAAKAARATELVAHYRTELEAAIAETDRLLAARRAEIEESLRGVAFRTTEEYLGAVEDRMAGDATAQNLQQRRDAAVQQALAVRTNIAQVNVDTALFGSGVVRSEPAAVPQSPAQPQPARDTALGAAIGLLAGVGLAWFRAERVRYADLARDAAVVLGAPLLGTVPVSTESRQTRVAALPKDGPAAEGYQSVAESLRFVLSRMNASTILVASPDSQPCQAELVVHLAAACVRDGRRALLVDCDLRTARLSQLAGAADAEGLTTLADIDVAFASCVRSLHSPDGQLVPLVPAGPQPESPISFLSSLEFEKALIRISEHTDLIFLHCPPVLTVADTAAIAAQADGILLVVSKGLPVDVLEECSYRLELTGKSILGYVFAEPALSVARSPRGYWRTQ